MANPCLYVSESYLSDLTNTEEITTGLQRLVGLLRLFFDKGFYVFLSNPYWEMNFGGNAGSVLDVILGEKNDLKISTELRREVSVHLDRCVISENPSISVDLKTPTIKHSISGKIYNSAAIIFLENGSLPLFLHAKNIGIKGNFSYDIAGREIFAYEIQNEECFPIYFRKQISISLPKNKDFLPLAKKAFPQLIFHEDIVLEDIGVDLAIHIETIMQHLAFLNDEYKSLGESLKWDIPKIQKAAKVKKVNFSDESDKTKRDNAKMKKRVVTFTLSNKEISFCCSLHTKITATAGRIHFHNPHAKSDSCVLIGKFNKHLPITK